MKKLKCIIFGSCLLMLGFAIAQEKPDEELVRHYLEANGSLHQYEFAYDQLLVMLNGQYAPNEANVDGWQYLKENKDEAITEMQSLLVPIYQSHFSTSDLTQMIAFYQTDTGRQMLKDRTQMSDTQKSKLNSYYNTEVGRKIIGKQDILSGAIGTASENWSRNLYETAVSLLKSE